MTRKLPKEMKAFCTIQPWAYVILYKGKIVENRGKNSHHRGVVAILGTKPKSKAAFQEDCDYCLDEYGVKVNLDKVPYGVIVGFAIMTDVIMKKPTDPKLAKWYNPGSKGYVLKNTVAIKEPVECKGKRGVFTLTGKPLQDALKQLTPAQRKKLEL